MTVRYNIAVDSEGSSTVTLVDGGLTATLDGTHPGFARVVAALVSGEDPWPFVSATGRLEAAVEKVADPRLTVDPEGAVAWKGAVAPSPVQLAIRRYETEGRDSTALVRFMERLEANPSQHARAQLFQWLERHGLRIDDEGFIVGYKAVRQDLSSSHSGSAIVDGVSVNGHIPTRPGSVISMPRDRVTQSPTVECGAGLHVGTWSYARTFGPVVLEMRIDPADVVSVPDDGMYQKLRCCRYQAVAVHGVDADDLGHLEPEATTHTLIEDSLSELVPRSFIGRLIQKLRSAGAVEDKA